MLWRMGPVPASYNNKDLDWSQRVGPLHSLLAHWGHQTSCNVSCPEVVAPYTASLVDMLIDKATNGTGQINVDINTTSSAEGKFGGQRDHGATILLIEAWTRSPAS